LSPLEATQVSGWQVEPPTHTLLPPHTQPLPAAEQSVLQLSELPQPSPMAPQYWPLEVGLQVTGVQTAIGPLHRLSWQVHPVFGQVAPQASELPQPSPMSPQ
jgi:hypothetical protein